MPAKKAPYGAYTGFCNIRHFRQRLKVRYEKNAVYAYVR
jgi:hypothetical protein